MSDERTRILRMLAEGTISVEECDELLRSLSERKAEKVERDIQEARQKHATWPFVLLVVLGAIWGLSWLRDGGMFRFGFPARIGTLFLLGAAFWVWMLIDCITRQPSDFRLLFTTRHEHEKWIWCGILLLANWLGAIVYFACIYRPTRYAARPLDPVAKAPVDPDEGYTPSPPARSLRAFIWLGLLLAVVAFAAPAIPSVHGLLTPSHARWMFPAVPLLSGSLAGAVLTAWLAIFWIWMLIDCIARDYRDFGTLVPTDRSLDKVLWILLILFTTVIGALAYHISVRRRVRKLPGEKAPQAEEAGAYDRSERKG